MLHNPRRVLRVILSRMHTRTLSCPTRESLLAINPHTLDPSQLTRSTLTIEVAEADRIVAVLADTLAHETIRQSILTKWRPAALLCAASSDPLPLIEE